MSVLCFLHFFTNLISSSLEITSRICPEFFMFGICPGLSIQNLSRIFHVRICLEFVPIYLSRICPEFLYWTNTGQFLDNFWMKPNSKYCICVKKMDDFRTCKIYSGQFLDIFDDIFRTFSFYRAVGWGKS